MPFVLDGAVDPLPDICAQTNHVTKIFNVNSNARCREKKMPSSSLVYIFNAKNWMDQIKRHLPPQGVTQSHPLLEHTYFWNAKKNLTLTFRLKKKSSIRKHSATTLLFIELHCTLDANNRDNDRFIRSLLDILKL